MAAGSSRPCVMLGLLLGLLAAEATAAATGGVAPVVVSVAHTANASRPWGKPVPYIDENGIPQVWR
jgi:hypothetical protein